MIAVVVGVPGVGKTTVVREALKHVPLREVNYGDVFLSVARKLYGIEERDEIRKRLTASQYENLHREAAKVIKKMAKEPIILDTHALVALKTGFMPGFPYFVLQDLPISLFVIVEADPEEIRKRRERDNRKRGGGPEDEISLHQELNRMAVITYAVLKGASVYIIKNEEGKQEEAGKELAEVLKLWLSGFGYR